MATAEWRTFRRARELKAEPLKTTPSFYVSLADSDDLGSFRPFLNTTKLVNITGKGYQVGFSGVIRYETTLELRESQTKGVLDLGAVGQTARVWLNGKCVGFRVCPPYRFELKGFAKAGKNRLQIDVANTLANKVRDHFSYFMQLTPSGLLGPITILS